MNRRHLGIAALIGASTLAFAGCTADPGAPLAGPTSSTRADQEFDQALHDRLPDAIKASGVINSANTGSFPPYVVVESDGSVTGATAELADAVGEVLGVKIVETTSDGLASVLTGIQAGRYDMDMGPVGDVVSRQAQASFVDYVQEYVVFAVGKGNPKKITNLASTCGARIAVQAGGSAERVITAQAATCLSEGKPAIEVQSYKDQPSSVLAVQSERADAFFSSQAPLTYFVKQSNGALELAGVGEGNGFDTLYQGAVVSTDSSLGEVLLAAMQKLKDNGTYEAIMTEWGLGANKLDTLGINLSKE
jgi:polar amino acid transport system substrate-binding protein